MTGCNPSLFSSRHFHPWHKTSQQTDSTPRATSARSVGCTGRLVTCDVCNPGGVGCPAVLDLQNCYIFSALKPANESLIMTWNFVFTTRDLLLVGIRWKVPRRWQKSVGPFKSVSTKKTRQFKLKENKPTKPRNLRMNLVDRGWVMCCGVEWNTLLYCFANIL